jgi:hypothetical protein
MSEACPISEVINEFHPSSPNYNIVKNNIQLLINMGFSRVINVRGDGMCLIYAIIAYIFETRDNDSIYTILEPFCTEEILSGLIDSPKTVKKHIETIARNVATAVTKHWSYIGESRYHMDENAIDGLAIRMVMKLLAIDRLICHVLLPKPLVIEYNVNDSCESKSLREGIPAYHRDDISGWMVTLLSVNRCHYRTLL